jgi:predicted Holliday junction resolvase-like endonuclease
MIEIFLILVIVIITILFFLAIIKIFDLKEEIASIQYLKRSQSVKYGQLTEQWLPFLKNFPYNSQNFRFIGKPIDGLLFDDDKIVFVEFKTNTSSLSKVQRKVKNLVKEKKVEWFELRIE